MCSLESTHKYLQALYHIKRKYDKLVEILLQIGYE